MCPPGCLKRETRKVLIRTQGEFNSLDEIRNTVITTRDGTPIQVKDIATVEDSWKKSGI